MTALGDDQARLEGSALLPDDVDSPFTHILPADEHTFFAASQGGALWVNNWAHGDFVPFTTETSQAEVIAMEQVDDSCGRIATLDDGRRVAARADESSRDAAAREGLIGARIRLEGSPLRFHCER